MKSFPANLSPISPNSIPKDFAETFRTGFRDCFLVDYSPGSRYDLEEDVPALGAIKGPYRLYGIQIPGPFYQHVKESLDLIALILFRNGEVKVFSRIESEKGKERLDAILGKMHASISSCIPEPGSHAAEARFLSLEKDGANYETPVDRHNGDLMDVREWLSDCEDGSLIDDDGHGYAVRDGFSDQTKPIHPSDRATLPSDATHIHWFNK